MRSSETAEMILTNAASPGQCARRSGRGVHQAMKILDGGRISIASLALGMAKGALERPHNTPGA